MLIIKKLQFNYLNFNFKINLPNFYIKNKNYDNEDLISVRTNLYIITNFKAVLVLKV